MQAVRIQAFGSPDGMVVVEVPEPTAGPGDVLIATEAIGVAGVDVVLRNGTLGDIAPAGIIPGSEVAGVVSAVGDGVDAEWIGRRVWASTGLSGGYAEQAVAKVSNVVALPPGLASIKAVTLGSAGPVAHGALRRAGLAAGERVLIRGAAGSIGIAAVQLAARAGAEVSVTTSSLERGDRLRTYGAVHLLGRDGLDSSGQRPGAFDVILDIVGGAAVPAFLERLAPNGRYVMVGVVAGFPPPDFGSVLLDRFQQTISFSTFSLNTVPSGEVAQVRADIFAAAEQGRLAAEVADVLPLHHAAQAHRRMDAGGVFGRIVLTT